MKRLLLILKVLILFLMMPNYLYAYDFESGGIYYNYLGENNVSVTSSDTNYQKYQGSIVIPSQVTYNGQTYSVTIIGASAFRECSGLISIIIPNSVTSIGEFTFLECNSLTSIIIPNSVTSIGSNAFAYCSGLTSVTIPNSVKSIDSFAFYRCSSLTTIVSEIEKPFVIDASVFNSYDAVIYTSATLIVPKGTKAAYQTTEGWNQFTNIVEAGESEPDQPGLIHINDIYYKETGSGEAEVVSADNGVTNITIPSTISHNNKSYKVTSIGDSAFYRSSISSISIPNSVTTIGYCAFKACAGLTSVTIPNSVTFISYSAFSKCVNLTSVIIGNSVTTIHDGTFLECSSLTSITIPASMRTIESSAFVSCTALTSVHISDLEAWCKITNQGLYSPYHLFLNGIEIIDLVIPNTVVSINDFAFHGCSGLTSVTIPNSVTSIGISAFYGCSSLTSIVSEIDKPFKIYNSVFEGIPADAQLIVPKGTKAAYQATEGWNQFTNIVEAGESEPDQSGQIHINDIFYKVTESGEAEVVSADNGVTSITIPSTISHNNTSYKVTAIAKDAFENCEHLAAVIWEPEVQFNTKIDNPNFLLYVSDEKYASRSVKNVVVNGVAESIELTDDANGNDFYCPRVFRAKNIIYKHNYQMETGIGDSRGWETIVLPFDVQKYTHATKGELESFTTWSKGSNKKPFWLFELTASGYKDVAGIKANTPYIISLPNNQQYEQQYQIPGVVTFSASNLEVQKSDNLKPGSYQGRSLVPNYANKDGDDCLALNVNNYYVMNPSKDIAGSKFIRGLRAVHPFEAYMTTTDNTRSIDVMDGMTTAIRGIQMVNDELSTIKVYDTRGVLMKTATSIDDVRNGLKVGVYIVNGKKMIIK